MVAVVERCIPERHDGVAHILVDRSLARADGVETSGVNSLFIKCVRP